MVDSVRPDISGVSQFTRLFLDKVEEIVANEPDRLTLLRDDGDGAIIAAQNLQDANQAAAQIFKSYAVAQENFPAQDDRTRRAIQATSLRGAITGGQAFYYRYPDGRLKIDAPIALTEAATLVEDMKRTPNALAIAASALSAPPPQEEPSL